MTGSKTSILEALALYPVSSHVTATLERKDVYALALSCRAIFYSLNIQDPVSHQSILSRCLQKCHGPGGWGVPEYVIAPLPRDHDDLVQEGIDMDVRSCVMKNCWNDVCKHCRQPPPIGSELRRRWICGSCLPWRTSLDTKIPKCSCSSAGKIFCLDCTIWMQNDDDNYYDFSEYCNSSFTEAADPSECKNGERKVYSYSCWDCEKMGEPPYDGEFICRWCTGSLEYTDLVPWDIIPYSKPSCRVPLSSVPGGGGWE